MFEPRAFSFSLAMLIALFQGDEITLGNGASAFRELMGRNALLFLQPRRFPTINEAERINPMVIIVLSFCWENDYTEGKLKAVV